MIDWINEMVDYYTECTSHFKKNALSLLFYLQYMEDILEQIHLGSP